MIQALRLTVAVLLVNFSTSTSVGKVYNPSEDACMEELNLKYIYGGDSPETQYNRTCIAKCTFEKDGKVDADGNLVASNFPSEEQDAVVECWKLNKADDLCKKVEAVSNCVYRKSVGDWHNYEECEKYQSSTDDGVNNCYTRCQLIVGQALNADGSVNLSSIVINERSSENTATKEDALNICKDWLVVDEDKCTNDLVRYFCVAHIMYHWSLNALKHEIECSKEHDVYPFYGDKSRNCYDHCVLIKNKELNADNILESNAFKTSGMSGKIREAYDTCKSFYHETDKCTRELYFYDCINYLQYASPDYLEKQIECATESKSPIVQFRLEQKENYCNTKCIMIKDGKLDENGQLNKTHLEQLTAYNAIIEESITFCKERFHGDDCAQQVFVQYCANSRITDEVNKKCKAEITRNENGIINRVEGYYCSSRCFLIHERHLDLEGGILIEPLLAQTRKTVDTVQEAIKHCKVISADQSQCTKDINTYRCVQSELWKTE